MTCNRRVDGVAPASGGPAVSQWTTVYEVDFIEAFNVLGATDLNSVGSSFTYEGVTWVTRTVANSGNDMVTTATSFGITAKGLEIVDAVGGTLTSGGAMIFATLSDLAANTATPFDADPTRSYLYQIYISEFTASSDNEATGVVLWKPGAAPTPTTWASLLAGLYRRSGVTNTPYYQVRTGARVARTDLTSPVHDVPTIHYAGTGHSVDGYCGQFGTDWPENPDLRAVSTCADNVSVSYALVGNPQYTRLAFGFEGKAGSGLDSVIEKVRIMQL